AAACARAASARAARASATSSDTSSRSATTSRRFTPAWPACSATRSRSARPRRSASPTTAAPPARPPAATPCRPAAPGSRRAAADTGSATINAAALLPEDVVVIEAQLGDGDALDTLGAGWKPALDGFLARGGVVVVVEGVAGTSSRAAHGAGLYDVTTPADATSQQVVVLDPADAV